MKKKVGIIKRVLCIGLIFLLSINSFAAIVSDNDGSAFITKAEFDALKSSFQSQIDSYNQSIDSKIDGAIASYLAGIRLSTTQELDAAWDKYLNVKRSTTSGNAPFVWDYEAGAYQPYQDCPLTLSGVIAWSNAISYSGSSSGDPYMAGFRVYPRLKTVLELDGSGYVNELHKYSLVLNQFTDKFLNKYLNDTSWDSMGNPPMCLHAGFVNTGDTSKINGITKLVSADLNKFALVESSRSAENGEWQYVGFSELAGVLDAAATFSINPIDNSLEWTNKTGDLVCSWTNVRKDRLLAFIDTIDFTDVGLSTTYNTSVLKHSIVNQMGWHNYGTSDGANPYSSRTTNSKNGHGQWHHGSLPTGLKYGSGSSTVNGILLYYPLQIAAGEYFASGTPWDSCPWLPYLQFNAAASAWQGVGTGKLELARNAYMLLSSFWNCDIEILKADTNVQTSGSYTVKDYGLSASSLLTSELQLRTFYPNPDSWLVKDNAVSFRRKSIKYAASGLLNNEYIVPAGGMPIARIDKDGDLEFTLKNNGTKDIYIFAYADNTQDTLWGKTRSVSSLGVRNDTWDTNEATQLNTWLGTSGRDTALKIASGASKKFTLNDVKNGDYLWVGVLCKDKVKCPVDIENVTLKLEN